MRNVALAIVGAVTLGGVSAIAASLVQPSYTDQIAQRDAIAVQAEAVLQRTSFDTATLHVGPSKLESVNKFNRPLSNGAARNALEYYRFNYTAL